MLLRIPLATIALALAAPGLAQAVEPQPEQGDEEEPGGTSGDEDYDNEDIVVTGSRPPGSVIGNIPAEVTLNPGDIRSFGVSNLTDLLAELAPQTGSGQGRGGEGPVVLLNGKRISGFAEIRNIPTEAIQRLEILPEEVALKYGYRADQKVVNVVLRRRFNAITAELEGNGATEGGRWGGEIETSLFRISGDGRLNVAVEYEHSSPLTEDERDIEPEAQAQPYGLTGNLASAVDGAEIDPALSALLGRPATVIGVPASALTGAPSLAEFAAAGVEVSDVGRFRTLLPETDEISLNAVLARTIFDDVSATINGTVTYAESDRTLGPARAQLTVPGASAFSPFAADTRSTAISASSGRWDRPAAISHSTPAPR